MEEQQKRKWYKKKRYLILGGIISIFVVVVSIADSQPNYQPQVQGIQNSNLQTIPNSDSTVIPKVNNLTPAPQPSSDQNTTYKNIDGNIIPTPKYFNSVPAGATAKCRDGTYSFSQHRRGTCSHHGGVAQWL